MPHPRFDRSKVKMKPLAERANKVRVERDFLDPEAGPRQLTPALEDAVGDVAGRILRARGDGCPVILAFGAHTIKNGVGPVMIRLIERGWVTHLATNGAGIIHDWEFAFQGESSEDVRAGVERGEFGNWEETGRWINLALNVGSFEGRGYGESVGALIEREGLELPAAEALEELIGREYHRDPELAAAACDLLAVLRRSGLASGKLAAPHPWKGVSIQAAAFRLGVPFTGHPMFGHDIIYNHPLNHGASLGRAAERDFLSFAHAVSLLEGGVYLSVGSAVMSPMIFEKSLSISQNVALQEGRRIEHHFMLIVDLAASHWDWSRGEPPEDNPDYYLRYNKTFARMGGKMRYLSADNRDFLPALGQELARQAEARQ